MVASSDPAMRIAIPLLITILCLLFAGCGDYSGQIVDIRQYKAGINNKGQNCRCNNDASEARNSPSGHNRISPDPAPARSVMQEHAKSCEKEPGQVIKNLSLDRDDWNQSKDQQNTHPSNQNDLPESDLNPDNS